MPPRQSTDAELDALMDVGERLSGFDPSLSAEWIDGALTALVAGPSVPPAAAAVVDALFGDTWARTFADPDDVAAALTPLEARWRVLRSQLDPEALWDAPDALRLSPLMLEGPAEDGGTDTSDGEPRPPRPGEAWAAGFRAVVDDPAFGWAAARDDEDASAWLGQIGALALDAAALADHLRRSGRGEGLPARDRLIDDAGYAVQDLRLWWIEHAPRTAPRRAEARPGRNDPCFCGSGKKFKKCHGAG